MLGRGFSTNYLLNHRKNDVTAMPPMKVCESGVVISVLQVTLMVGVTVPAASQTSSIQAPRHGRFAFEAFLWKLAFIRDAKWKIQKAMTASAIMAFRVNFC